jgi:hypothetical protein
MPAPMAVEKTEVAGEIRASLPKDLPLEKSKSIEVVSL